MNEETVWLHRQLSNLLEQFPSEEEGGKFTVILTPLRKSEVEILINALERGNNGR